MHPHYPLLTVIFFAGNISCWDLTNIHSMMAASAPPDVKTEPVIKIFSLQLPGKVSQLSVSLEAGLLLAISDGFLYSVNIETVQIVSRSVNGDGALVCSSHTSLQLPDEQQPQRLEIAFFACRSGLSILSLPTLATLRFVPNLQIHSICECFGGVAATTESQRHCAKTLQDRAISRRGVCATWCPH